MKCNKLQLWLKTILVIASISLQTNSVASENNSSKGNHWLDLAKMELNKKELDQAEDYIEKALETSENNADYLFMAGRIAGAQAQEASIFSKLGYARDAKKHFEHALSIDPRHKDSILGLIRFHEQAPVMAGGEKESIPALIDQLRAVDKQLAFSMESGNLIDKKEFDLLQQRYSEALEQLDSNNPEQFKYDYAMTLSNYGYYSRALDIILTVKLDKPELLTDFAEMRFYQVAKLAAESRRKLDLGIASIKQYADLLADVKTIPDDWIDFRLKQLLFLKGDKSVNQETFKSLKASTKEKSLKEKIASFLKEIKA